MEPLRDTSACVVRLWARSTAGTFTLPDPKLDQGQKTSPPHSLLAEVWPLLRRAFPRSDERGALSLGVLRLAGLLTASVTFVERPPSHRGREPSATWLSARGEVVIRARSELIDCPLVPIGDCFMDATLLWGFKAGLPVFWSSARLSLSKSPVLPSCGAQGAWPSLLWPFYDPHLIPDLCSVVLCSCR